MLLKIIVVLAAAGLLWTFLVRQFGGPRIGKSKPARVPRIETLARCPDCGVYRIYGGGCECSPHSGSAE